MKLTTERVCDTVKNEWLRSVQGTSRSFMTDSPLGTLYADAGFFMGE